MSDAGDDLPAIALALLDALHDAGLPAALGGGLAFNLWAIPRVTKDVDLNVFVGEDRHADALDVLAAASCRPTRDGAAWDESLRRDLLRRAREGEVVILWRGDVRIDVFFPSIPFYAEAERTLRRVTFPDGRARPVLSPEALAVFKLLFFRDKDVADLRRLVAIRGADLDAAWVRARVVEMLGDDAERVATWDEIVEAHGPR